jgi:hypothetical protein
MIKRCALIIIAALIIYLIAVIIFFSMPFYWHGDEYLNENIYDIIKNEKLAGHSIGNFEAKQFIILEKKRKRFVIYHLWLIFNDNKIICNTRSKNIIYLKSIDTILLYKERIFDGKKISIYYYIWPLGKFQIYHD